MSPHRIVLPAVGAVLGSLLAVGTPAPAAQAAPDPAAALDLPAGVTASISGSATVETQTFNDFPSRGSEYVVLSTGAAEDVMLPAPLAIDDPRTPVFEREPDPLVSTDRGGDGVVDSTTLTLTVDPSAAAACLYVDFAMATDETVRQYIVGTAGDSLSVTKQGDETEYAMNAGRGYFAQEGWPEQPRPYTTNDIDYWHEPGDREDVDNGQLETPRLARWTPLTNVTTRDTARVPLDLTGGAEVIEVVVADTPGDQGELDTAAFVDNVRTTMSSCEAGPAAQPAHQYGEGSIKGERRVGYPLTYDPVPSTAEIERYDAADNGWTYPGAAAPVDLRFRWYRTSSVGAYDSHMEKWTPIPDADRQSYVPTNLDRGKVLIVLVTGVVDGRRHQIFPNTSDAGTAPQKWYVTLPIDYGVFQDGSTPMIQHDGSPKVGEELTVQPVATRPLQDSWSYQWKADGSAIQGATSDSLVLAAAQRGKRITVTATAERSQFTSRTWTSLQTPIVAGNEMESVGTVSIDTPSDEPSAVVGEQLTAEPGPTCELAEPSGGACAGSWSLGTSFTYQWRRDGQNISGATGATYLPVTQDAGRSLTVVVGGSKPGYDPVSATSAPISIVGLPMLGAEPVITGTAMVGLRLTGSVTDWSPSGSSLTYSWYAGETLLQSGTSRYLTVPPAAVGKPIALRVRGTKTGYEPLTRSSEPTVLVVPGTLTSSTPRIIGLARVGYTLTASPGYWGPSGVRLSYQWKVGGKAVTGKAGRKSTFKIPKSAKGKRITVVVTGRLAGYTTVKKTSAKSDKVTR